MSDQMLENIPIPIHNMKRHLDDTVAVFVDDDDENKANTAEGISVEKPRSPVKEASPPKRKPLGNATHNR